MCFRSDSLNHCLTVLSPDLKYEFESGWEMKVHPQMCKSLTKEFCPAHFSQETCCSPLSPAGTTEHGVISVKQDKHRLQSPRKTYQFHRKHIWFNVLALLFHCAWILANNLPKIRNRSANVECLEKTHEQKPNIFSSVWKVTSFRRPGNSDTHGMQLSRWSWMTRFRTQRTRFRGTVDAQIGKA